MNQRATRIGEVVDQPAIARPEGSRREFCGLARCSLFRELRVTMGNPLIAAETDDKKAKMTLVSNDSVTDAGEPIVYLNTPLSGDFLRHHVDPGWRDDGLDDSSGSRLRLRSRRHADRGVRRRLPQGIQSRPRLPTGEIEVASRAERRHDAYALLAVFFGGKDVPTVLNPPQPR